MPMLNVQIDCGPNIVGRREVMDSPPTVFAEGLCWQVQNSASEKLYQDANRIKEVHR